MKYKTFKKKKRPKKFNKKKVKQVFRVKCFKCLMSSGHLSIFLFVESAFHRKYISLLTSLIITGKVFLSNCPSAAPSGNLVSSPPADINLGLIRYVLHQENVQETTDHFRFLVRDSKPNVVSDNVFHIQWSLISFEHKRCRISASPLPDYSSTSSLLLLHDA